MRRLVFLVLAAALVSAASADAAFQPLRRGHGELGRSIVRPGTITVPSARSHGSVRVVVRLAQPPLARAFAGRSIASAGSAQVNVRSTASRGYLRRLAVAQQSAVTSMMRAIPEAHVGRSYRVVLNGFAVRLPAHRLPKLVQLPFVTRVYPSLRYSLATNESPALVGAPALAASTGAHGEGMRIAIVDDGVDQANRFFRPGGYSLPAGFPKGKRKWTTRKVIAARTFPGPGSGRRGRLAVDRRASFHGTHVAGIAAGNAGTAAPRGPDHPAVSGLSGVAPRAQLGNYRVFTVPTPVGVVANTPEIIAAFDAAVRDGMDVINFSGGGPQSDPENDALVEAIANVAAAGVVPVISAGNDRDEFGLGSAGSPGTAPEAISVAAASNTHVFTPVLQVTGANGGSLRLPFQPGLGGTPPAWASNNRPLVDVSSIVGRNGRPVDPKLCGPQTNPNGGQNQLPARSLRRAIALVARGDCTFDSKAERVRRAGGIGLVLVDNRPGEANAVPVFLDLPSGTIADADGTRLRAYLRQHSGRTTVRISRRPLQLETGRGGVVTSFSAGGPTAFGHRQKPDLAAPGGAILSATLKEFAGSPFAVFDGTSMAAPHVAGAAALLLQLHPGWTARQVKSALVSTAAPAWGNTEQTKEAPVILQGGGLTNVAAATRPLLFSEPASLSFGDLDVTGGTVRKGLFLSISDAGNGAGTWRVEIRSQSSGAGARLETPAFVTIPPGASELVPVVASADANAVAADHYGFLVLRRGTVVRRIPYLFLVTRPRLAGVRARPLRRKQSATTRTGDSHASVYRFPAAPFGTGPIYTAPPMNEGGAERLYVTHVTRPVANVGVSITGYTPGDALIHPWFLGSQDENDVQGYAGTPVNVNSFMLDYGIDLGAAGAVFPRQQRFFVAVDSGRDPFGGKQYPGRYTLRSWVNDVRPPRVRLLTARVAGGRPLVVARAIDRGSGIDPYSIQLGYRQILLSAAAYDPGSGLVLFSLPFEAPPLRPGQNGVVLVASDFQETKNVATPGDVVLPNTGFRAVAIRRTNEPVVTWLLPGRNTCAGRSVRLLAVASSTRPIRWARFLVDEKRIRTIRLSASGLYAHNWRPRGIARGKHVLRVVVRDAKRRTATATRTVRGCRRAR